MAQGARLRSLVPTPIHRHPVVTSLIRLATASETNDHPLTYKLNLSIIPNVAGNERYGIEITKTIEK